MEKNLEKDYLGSINISDDVISTIISIATNEIEGVTGLKQSINDELTSFFSKKGYHKGIRVDAAENIAIDLNVVIRFGTKIPEIAYKIQENVKTAIETMTELKVKEINVHIVGIDFSK